MGDISVILEGVESDEAEQTLYSTVHGTGRVMSRTAARGKINRKTGQIISPGSLSREMMMDWVRREQVELRGTGTDESLHCYKRLPEVLHHHVATIRVLHTLHPMGWRWQVKMNWSRIKISVKSSPPRPLLTHALYTTPKTGPW